MRLPHNIHHIIIIHRRRLGSTPTTASARPAATTTPRRHADPRGSCTRPSLRPHYNHAIQPQAAAPRDHQHGPRNMDIDITHLNPRASALRDTRTRTPLKLTRTTTTHATAVPLLSPPTTALPIPMPFLMPEATCQPTSAVYAANRATTATSPALHYPDETGTPRHTGNRRDEEPHVD